MAFPTLLLLGAVSSAQFVTAWPGGAPYKSCLDHFPHHEHAQQQKTPSPYNILLDQTHYAPGDVITVTIKGENQEPFRGFQIIAQRLTGNAEELIGEIIEYDKTTTTPKYWVLQDPIVYNCVTHNNNSDKTEVRFKWRAPSTSVGDLQFRGGFVKNTETFWASVRSEVLRASTPAPPTVFPARVQPFIESFPRDQECGDTRGCFKYPEGCTGDACQFIVTYKPSADQEFVHFEMMGQAEGYIALGFSKDKKMGGDNSIFCTSKDTRMTMQYGYNPALYTVRQPIDGLTDIRLKWQDGRIYCSFTRPTNHTLIVLDNDGRGSTDVVPVAFTFDLAEDWYLFFASGDLYWDSDVPQKHAEIPIVSDSMVSISLAGITSGQTLPTEIQVHVLLGLLAWLLLAGFCMLIPRHFREDLKRPLLGVAIWFQIHRAVMLLTACLTAAGIILIFVYMLKWKEEATIHGVFGLLTMGFTLVNIVVAFFRPGLDSARRPVFRWAHRIGAILIYVCAVVAMLLGSQIELLPLRVKEKLTTLVAVGVALQLVFELILELIKYRHNTSKASWSPKSQTPVELSETPPSTGWLPRIIVLILYTLAMAVITFLAIYVLF